MTRVPSPLAAAVVLLVGLGTLALASCGRDDGIDCGAMTTDVRYQVDPGTGAGLLTTTTEASDQARAAGYTTDQGTVFAAATSPASGLVAVHALRLPGGSRDQLWTTSATEARDAVRQHGYVDEGVVAYVAPTAAACTVQVTQFSSAGLHRYATSPEREQTLRAAGWHPDGSFYAARPRAGASSPSPSPSATPRPTSGVRTLVDATFDDVQAGPVTPESFNRLVGKTTDRASAFDSMTYQRTGDGRGGYVRTHLAAHRILDRNDQPGDGNVLVVELGVEDLDAACVSYRVRFRAGFDFAAGGKLPGLLGVAPGVSPGTPTGGGSVAHGWSGRVMWHGPTLWREVRESGQPDLAETYLYHPGQAGTYGDDLGWGRGFVDGTWHHVEQCYALNTLGPDGPTADGTLRAWLDGVLVLERIDVVYRTDPAVHITHLDWSVFRGGDTLDWAADTDGDVDLDDMVVTTG